MIYLNQAWSQEDREWYWHFSQGSAVLSYDIFLNLEAADSQDLFRSGLNSTRYGLIPDAANSNNPDGLPIGVSKTVVATPIKGWPAGDYVGLTCAACHEGQLRYKGKLIRIEGGINNTIDLQGLARGLDDALRATLTDAAKFDRLAGRLGASSPDAKDKLRKRAESESERVHEYATRTSITPHPWGPGRMDALAMIRQSHDGRVDGNSRELGRRGSRQSSLPSCGMLRTDCGRSGAASAQDPIRRNFDETMGVYLPIDLSSKSPAEGLFQSSAAILDLATGREPIGTLGAAELAGRRARQDRPRQSEGGEGIVRGTLRKLPQRLALPVDRTQQIRETFRPGRVDFPNICRHR